MTLPEQDKIYDLWSSYCTLRVCPIKPYFPMCMHGVPEAVFIIVSNGTSFTSSNHPVELVKEIKKLWYINTIKFYSGSHKREHIVWFHLCKLSNLAKLSYIVQL